MHKWIILGIFVFLAFSGKAQTKYSIDLKPPKERRVPVKYFIEQTKSNVKESSEIRKKHRALRKESRKIRRHTYHIQTKKVKRRMRRSFKEAEEFNRKILW